MTKALLKRIGDAVKGIVTTTIGIVTCIVTIFLVLNHTIDFMWSGAIGLVIGTALILSPDTLVTKISDLINKPGKKE